MQMKHKTRTVQLDNVPGTAFGMEPRKESQTAGPLHSFTQGLRNLNYRSLIPIQKLLAPSMFRLKAVQWVLIFGLIPILYFQAHRLIGFTPREIMWLIEIYFCLFWALYFRSVIQPDATAIRYALGTFIFTAGLGIPFLLYVQQLPLLRIPYVWTVSSSFSLRAMGYILGVGVFEETCKALPLILFVILRKKTIGLNESMYLGFMSGLGFAASEGVMYNLNASVITYITPTSLVANAASAQFMQFLFRIMSGPVLHGAWAGIAAWFIGYSSTMRNNKWPHITVGLALAALLHGTYDLFINNLFGIVVAGVTFTFFLGYIQYRIPRLTQPINADDDQCSSSAESAHEVCKYGNRNRTDTDN